jgi:flagellar biosynthesis chaperone FliJ
MTRPVDWSAVGYAHDPVPGEPDVIRYYAGEFSQTSQQINVASIKLSQILADAAGSEFIEEIKNDAQKVSERIKQAQTRYSRVAQSVRTYATPLQNAQDMADKALLRARRARSEEHAALNKIHVYQREMQEPGVTAEDISRYQHLIMQLNQDVRDWRAEITAATTDVQDAINAVAAAAAVAADSIDDVVKSSDLNDSWWDNVSQWVSENKDLIDAIVFVLVVALTILAFVFPVIALGLAIAAAAISIANALAQAATGNKPWGEALLDCALALLPFGIGKMANVAFKAISQATKARGVVSLMASKAGQAIKTWNVSKSMQFIESQVIKSKPLGFLQTRLAHLQEEMGISQLREIQQLASGSLLKGGGLSDSVAAMVQAGESVAALKGGTFIIEHINTFTHDAISNFVSGGVSELIDTPFFTEPNRIGSDW